jgi:Tfp pilus assembly protein PilN
LIKINLAREGRAVRGAGAAPAASAAAGPSNLNNILVIGGILLGILLAGGWWFLKNQTLKDRKAAVDQKTAEAQRLESIIKEVEDYQKRKDSLQKRIDLINDLKLNQKGPVRIMDRISQDLPDLVWLEHMEMSGGAIKLNGRGLNPNAIANFVENVKNDPLFEEPDLSGVSEVSQAPLVYAFDMTFHFSYAPKGTATAAGGAATTGTSGTSTSGSSTSGTGVK